MSAMFFNGGSKFLHVDGDGQLAEVASSSFPDVGVKVGLLLTECDVADELRQKLLEVVSPEFQIIYVDVDVDVGIDVEGEGSRWKEEREKRIRDMLLKLPEGSRAWTASFRKTGLLFAYSLWRFANDHNSAADEDDEPSEHAGGTWIVGTSVEVDEEGRRKLSDNLEMIFHSDGCDSRRVDLTTLFSPFSEAWKLMLVEEEEEEEEEEKEEMTSEEEEQ